MQADLSISESLMISAKPLLPFKVTYPQVPGIRTGMFGGAVVGGHLQIPRGVDMNGGTVYHIPACSN